MQTTKQRSQVRGKRINSFGSAESGPPLHRRTPLRAAKRSLTLTTPANMHVPLIDFGDSHNRESSPLKGNGESLHACCAARVHSGSDVARQLSSVCSRACSPLLHLARRVFCCVCEVVACLEGAARRLPVGLRAGGRWFVTPLHGGTSRMVKTRTRRDPHGKKKGEIKSAHHQRAYFMRVQFV